MGRLSLDEIDDKVEDGQREGTNRACWTFDLQRKVTREDGFGNLGRRRGRREDRLVGRRGGRALSEDGG